ncbi:hypothetical protein PAPYR_6167 [Paratrimastix pyriformis]|uniref:Spt4/RpoE2 zinc finger domain-containing protein n=1 Tax=Paratrimastix pyriformis TaxID=342808 RepID=A0ABQ8UG09_9EUKA|nr:hypothetical protein PAPYR_6167 [Paratrimastix pyriformis]
MQPGVCPNSFKQLRACLVCGLIKTTQQFVENGCENCEKYVHLSGDRERVLDCTTPRYQGVILLNDSNHSWVGKYLFLEGKYRGVYAIKASGILPPEVLGDLEARGVTPHCLNAS